MNELLISEIFHSIFSHGDWPWVTEILENEEGIIAVEINGNHFPCQHPPTFHNGGARMKDHIECGFISSRVAYGLLWGSPRSLLGVPQLKGWRKGTGIKSWEPWYQEEVRGDLKHRQQHERLKDDVESFLQNAVPDHLGYSAYHPALWSSLD